MQGPAVRTAFSFSILRVMERTKAPGVLNNVFHFIKNINKDCFEPAHKPFRDPLERQLSPFVFSGLLKQRWASCVQAEELEALCCCWGGNILFKWFLYYKGL